MVTTSEARSTFLNFFAANGHEVRPSSSLVPHNDPTLMFTNAGMNQFKNVFTGAEKLSFQRAATAQKCVRAGGKHNDLDNVGYTSRHHTFFEMLGNFSFGDYFKENAIELAWKLLTKEYAIPAEKLTFTVYHTDDEAFNLWKKITGCDDRRILRVPTKDNFWSMGDTGPCGPCSEIFYDHGEKAGKGEWALNADGTDRFDERFVEIWNLVFMQYEQVDENTRLDLPKPSIDTGMGLERVSAVLQGVHDNYDTDLFKGLITSINEEASKLGGQTGYGAPQKVLADHLRSSCFLIADGILPSNEGRGYVLRRIMRRAMRYAHQLGCKDPLMYKLVPSLITEMGAQYPELKRAEASITDNLHQEEERFKQTLERGLKILEDEVSVYFPKLSHNTSNAPLLAEDEINFVGRDLKFSGEVAFKLYDTYGFPLDLTQDILRSRGLGVDVIGFEKHMDQQREMARASHKGSGDTATCKIWFDLKEKIGTTTFVGYDEDEADGKVIAIVKDGASVDAAGAGDKVHIVLDKTPFYGESGGQTGDTGTFASIANITDTQKPLEDFIVHEATLLVPLKVGDAVHAAIDVASRGKIRANHSATHLLHKALRDRLGEHVTQKGSLVDADRLRFDFSHTGPMTREDIDAVEKRVNEIIAYDTPVECRVMAPEDAIKAGAMALFGEKYGDEVRVLSMGKDNFSTELCGGTHVQRTGDIQLFKITSETGIAAGIRRIEAVTRDDVRSHFEKQLLALSEQVAKLQAENEKLVADVTAARETLGSTGATPKAFVVPEEGAKSPFEGANMPEFHAIFAQKHAKNSEISQKIQDENKQLSKQLADLRKQLAMAAGSDAKMEKLGNVQFIGKIFDGLDAKELRGLAENYLKQIEQGIVFVGTVVDGKASVVVGVDKFLTELYSAVGLVQAAVSELGGKGGGGKPELAQGGGPEADKLPSALDKIKSMIGG
ncbi:MAG: alanine--tRNA ligase [Alphaproteobacteria bacterium]|nr:alanine--tRNA ligase [Alphaproteobacteria bacterium]